MKMFIMEYRVEGYNLGHAYSLDPKAGRRIFSVSSEDIKTEDIREVHRAARARCNVPEGYWLFQVRDRDTGETVP